MGQFSPFTEGFADRKNSSHQAYEGKWFYPGSQLTSPFKKSCHIHLEIKQTSRSQFAPFTENWRSSANFTLPTNRSFSPVKCRQQSLQVLASAHLRWSRVTKTFSSLLGPLLNMGGNKPAFTGCLLCARSFRYINRFKFQNNPFDY